MQLVELYQDAVQQLVRAGIDEAQSNAAQLIEFHFGLNRSQLILQGSLEVDDKQNTSFREILDRRIRREPLQYITGTREFWSLDFTVSPSVLIPRPETEFLLDLILSNLTESELKPDRVLDMCTGSGVIAVVLAREVKPDTLLAVDSSKEALTIASRNIKRHAGDNQVTLLCSDLFSAIREKEDFELIVANPPYIAEGDLKDLEPEVREWEPESALISGRDGLDIITRIVEHAPLYLRPGGRLYVEIGSDQAAQIQSLFTGTLTDIYEQVEIVNDWAGRPRVLTARKKESV